jgi:RNA polymerase sigma-70 factor (ECF subfamily)
VVLLKPEFEEFIGSDDEDIPLSLSLQELMDTLQEDEKSVILMKFYNDKTLKEISEALEIPLGTAKSVLYRALDKLRKNYKREAGYYE